MYRKILWAITYAGMVLGAWGGFGWGIVHLSIRCAGGE